MHEKIVAWSLLLMMLLTATVPSSMASDAPVPRSTPPPGTEWNITSRTEIAASTTFSGNVTVLGGGELVVRNTAVFKVAPGWRLHLLGGGSVQVIERSTLETEYFTGEPGSSFTVQNSNVRGGNVFNASVKKLTISDSTILIRGMAGGPGFTDGGNASVVLWGNTSSNIVGSNITARGGDGYPGKTGAPGGKGGDASLSISSTSYLCDNILVLGGSGGAGGSPQGAQSDGWPGGTGGLGELVMAGTEVLKSSISCEGGNGGAGTRGFDVALTRAGNGGSGGNGGPAIICLKDKFRTVNSSALHCSGGAGGSPGAGGSAQTGQTVPGNGGNGGNGGPSVIGFEFNGSISLNWQETTCTGGPARAGAPAGTGFSGTGGKGGAGGAGGSSGIEMKFSGDFSCSSSSVTVRSAPGESGGPGNASGPGGMGGNCSLSISGIPGSGKISMQGVMLDCTGGRGGDGAGTAVEPVPPVVPGNGGCGGNATFWMSAVKGIAVEKCEVSCRPGECGGAGQGAISGSNGTGTTTISTGRLVICNSTVPDNVGCARDGNIWEFINTGEPDRAPANISGGGVAYIYNYWTGAVKDPTGAPLLDANIGVQLTNTTENSTMRADKSGRVYFQILTAVQRADSVDVRAFADPLSVWGWDDRGHYSSRENVGLDRATDIIVFSKSYPPVASIYYPEPSPSPVLDATAYLINNTTIPLIVEGAASDNALNYKPFVSRMQIRIAQGDWMELPVRTATALNWNYSFDIYNWSLAMVGTHPAGQLPLTVRVRCFNGWIWSDDAEKGGADIVARFIVLLRQIPPPLPDVEITSPAFSFKNSMGMANVSAIDYHEFSASVVQSYGTVIVRWVWDFDDTDGFAPEYSSDSGPLTRCFYPEMKQGQFFFATIKIYDNASARRVELLNNGVPYRDFGYEFDPSDGSASTRVRIHVLVAPPPPMPSPENLPGYGQFAIAAAVLVLCIVGFLVWRRKKTPGGPSARAGDGKSN